MIWKSCDLQIKEGQTEDVLGNQTGGKWSTVKKTVCRFTPWTDEQISLEGREVTRNEQRFRIFLSVLTQLLTVSVRKSLKRSTLPRDIP